MVPVVITQRGDGARPAVMCPPECGQHPWLNRCVCCGEADGVEREGVMGVEIDPSTGLCLYCQPCPACGRTGTGCDDDGARVVCAP